MDEQNEVLFQVTKGDLALFLERRGIEPQDEWFAYVREAQHAIRADDRLTDLLREAFEAALGRVRGEVARDTA